MRNFTRLSKPIHSFNEAVLLKGKISTKAIIIVCISLLATNLLMRNVSDASVIEHVNVGRVIVQNQSLRSQQMAGKEALEQVFIKLSGNIHIISEPEIARAVNNYEQFLVASSFIQQQQNLVLEARFNQHKVESLLLASGLSVWTNLRPSSVLWLAIEDSNNQKTLITQNSSSTLLSAVSQQSYARGVDIIMPLGDFQDATEVSVYDVWNQYVSQLQDHSQRYNTDFLISATVQAYNAELAADERQQKQEFDDEVNRLAASMDERTRNENRLAESLNNDAAATSQNQNDGQEMSDLNAVLESASAHSQANAMTDAPVPDNATHKLDYIITLRDFRLAKRIETGRIYATSETEAVQRLVDLYANMLAKQFSLRSQTVGENESIMIVIDNIDSLDDYINLLALVKTIPAVSQVRLIKQVGSQSFLAVEQSISVQQLKSILALDNRLTIRQSDQSTDILFSWQG